MSDIPTLLARIPDEYKPFAALCLGSIMLVVLILFHGVSLHLISVQQKRGQRSLRQGRPYIAAGAFLFGWSVFLMLALHLVEILIWAFAITHAGIVKHVSDAMYFCANAYTTLGMGSLDVDQHWRIISPVIAISGLFTFAWTTGALVDVVASNGRLLEQLEAEREEEMHMRFALSKEEWNVLKTERSEEASEKKKTRTQAAGVSFFQRHKIWQDERKSEKELRNAAEAQMKDLRVKERQDEEKLGKAPTDANDKESL